MPSPGGRQSLADGWRLHHRRGISHRRRNPTHIICPHEIRASPPFGALLALQMAWARRAHKPAPLCCAAQTAPRHKRRRGRRGSPAGSTARLGLRRCRAEHAHRKRRARAVLLPATQSVTPQRAAAPRAAGTCCRLPRPARGGALSFRCVAVVIFLAERRRVLPASFFLAASAAGRKCWARDRLGGAGPRAKGACVPRKAGVGRGGAWGTRGVGKAGCGKGG
jgi:hypothetical protein